MAVNDLYVCTTFCRTAEGVMQFTFGYKMDAGVIGAGTLRLASLEFALNRLDALMLAISSDVEVDKVAFHSVTNFDDIPGFVNFNNIEGALGGESVPNSSNAVISLKTNAPNAKHNGRMYIPGVVETDQDEGTLKAAVKTALNVFGTKLELDLVLAGPETAEFTPVVISRIVDGAPRVPPVGFSLVSALVRPNMKQQRKRGGRRFGLSG